MQFFNCAKFLSFKAQKFKIYTHEELVVEQIFFKLSLKTTLGDVHTQNNLDLEILKKKVCFARFEKRL